MKRSLLKILVLGGLTVWVALTTSAVHPIDLQTTPTSVPLITLSGHTDVVTQLAWSPDGSLLASSAANFDSQDTIVHLWQSDGQAVAALSGHTAPVSSLAWSPDGTILATGSHDESIKLWQKDGTLIQTIQPNAGIVFALAWSPDGATLASGSIATPTQNTVQLWDKDGKLLQTMTTEFSGGKFYNLAWSPDGKYLVGGATDYSEWKADGTFVFSSGGCSHCPPAWGFAWSPDSQTWSIGNESGLIWVYTIEGKEIVQMQSTEGVDKMQWSRDGKWMADSKNLWQVKNGKFVLKNYLKGLRALDWSPNSRYIASASANTVYIQQADGKVVVSLKDHADQVAALAWSPDGNNLAYAAHDHNIYLWNVADLP